MAPVTGGILSRGPGADSASPLGFGRHVSLRSCPGPLTSGAPTFSWAMTNAILLPVSRAVLVACTCTPLCGAELVDHEHCALEVGSDVTPGRATPNAGQPVNDEGGMTMLRGDPLCGASSGFW